MMSFTAKRLIQMLGATQLSHVSIFPQSEAVLQSFLESHVFDLFKDYKAVIFVEIPLTGIGLILPHV